MYILIKLDLRSSLFLFDEDIIVVIIIFMFYLIQSQFQNTTSVIQGVILSSFFP